MAKTNIGCQSYMAVSQAIPNDNIDLDSETDSNPPRTARTNQGRSPRRSNILHGIFRCLVSRSLNHRSRNRTLPLPTRNLFERVCSIDRNRSWRSTELTRSLLGDGEGFRSEMFGETGGSKTYLRSITRSFLSLSQLSLGPFST